MLNLIVLSRYGGVNVQASGRMSRVANPVMTGMGPIAMLKGVW